MTSGCNPAFAEIMSGFGASWDPEKSLRGLQKPLLAGSVPDSHKRKDNFRLDRLSKRRRRRELCERHHFSDPTIDLGILRSRQNLVIENPPFVSNISFNGERLLKGLIVARGKT